MSLPNDVLGIIAVKTKPFSSSYFDNVDSDKDIIRKGAYQKTIQENGNRVKYLYQHNMMQPIGKMKELYEDEKGLMFPSHDLVLQ